MEEPVRLACPRCELVYRLKKLTPGKRYTCKNCGGALLPPEAIDDETIAAASAPGVTFEPGPARPSMAAGLAPESALSRLPQTIEQLAERLDALKELDLSGGAFNELKENLEEISRRVETLDQKIGGSFEDGLRGFTADLDHRIEELDRKIDSALQGKFGDLNREVVGKLGEMDEKVTGALDGKLHAINQEMHRQLGDLHQKVVGVSERVSNVADSVSGIAAKAIPPASLDLLRQEMKTSQEALAKRLFDNHEAQRKEINTLLSTPAEDSATNTTVEVDIDELADRLVAGVRGHGRLLDPDAESAVDAMARLADNLVKEQANNTARLDRLTEEIHAAAAGISKLDEWRGDLPERVADEIGQTVEARVVGPISGALAKQAPTILSELQDTKLVDIVSRSVREAQRPLLREILAGGRGGVPVWLFASVLLPLLLILGYLFLPGEVVGGRDYTSGVSEEVAESLARIEGMLGVTADNDDRMRTIEDAVLDIHSEALAHVKNAAGLEEEVKNLKATLAERDRLIKDYNETLQSQVKRLREYEMRLVQLGVSPKSIGE